MSFRIYNQALIEASKRGDKKWPPYDPTSSAAAGTGDSATSGDPDLVGSGGDGGE